MERESRSSETLIWNIMRLQYSFVVANLTRHVIVEFTDTTLNRFFLTFLLTSDTQANPTRAEIEDKRHQMLGIERRW